MSRVWNIPFPESEVRSVSRTTLNDGLSSLLTHLIGTGDISGAALVDGAVWVNLTTVKLRGRASGVSFDLGDWGVAELGHVRKDGTVAMTAAFDAGGFVVKNLAAPAAANDAARKTDLDAKLAKAGSTLDAAAKLSYSTTLPSLTANEDLTHKGYCDLKVLKAGDTMTGQLQVTQAAALTGVKVQQNGVGIGLDIAQTQNAVGLNILKTGVGAGNAATIENDGTGIGLFIKQDGIAVGLQVTQNGNSIGMAVQQTQAQIGFEVDQQANAIGVFISKTGTGVGNALDIDNDGTGIGLRVNQDGVADGIRVLQNANNRAVLINKIGTGAGDVLEVFNAGSGKWIDTDTPQATPAHLPSSGIWTDGTCFEVDKIDIRPIMADASWLDRIKQLRVSRYADRHAKNDPVQNKHIGLFQDDLVRLFDVSAVGIRPREIAAIAINGVKALIDRLDRAGVPI